ncbi:MAG TPA: mechanosensitive ion channel domain-containing protein [Gemmatimonadaceae bacterium]|nr:mechanosensitive ion channel domain-containing protein [Gemmatimonadaceae bacterium]
MTTLMLARIGITIALVAGILIVGGLLRAGANAALHGGARGRAAFWASQVLHLATLAAVIVAVFAVWKDAAGQLTAVAGWIAAGLTVALQRVVTAFAGYVIILRGNVFNIGDRITIGGVRGDVVALGFMQTTVMEMGQPPDAQHDAPAMWVHGRQNTGRLVRVTNDKIFDTPIYNYTREFPFIWDELMFPIRYADDRRVVERILLDVARRHTAPIVQAAAPRVDELCRVYHLRHRPEIDPRVFYHLTDNWLALSLRFLARDHEVRGLKDAMSREILDELDRVHIGIASGTYAIVEMPTLRVREQPS